MSTEIQQYGEAVRVIKEAILQSQYRSAKLITGEQLSLYFGIGCYVSRNSRKGRWGTGAINRISFSHHMEILHKTKGLNEILFYIHQTVLHKWDKYDLRDRLKADIYATEGAAANNFAQTMPTADARKAVGMFKDEYLLDYINVEEMEVTKPDDVDERVVELKKGAFEPGYIGQLQAYMRVLDDKARKPHENPTIGILLCKSANKAFVEYVIRDYNSPMGVATYKTAADMDERLRRSLPDMEDMRNLLTKEDEANV